MKEETVVQYTAEDGTPFGKNKLACQNYEALCSKYREWLRSGKVMFWSKEEDYINFSLIDYTYQDGNNYLDLLKRVLQNSGFLIIDSQPDREDWEELWEFVTNYVILSATEQRKIPYFYEAGDLLAFDCQDCCFHNMSLVIRRASACDKRLKENLVKTFKQEGK